jgi:hypothetical protein
VNGDTEFVDYLLDIQQRAHNLHLRMQTTFEQSRGTVSQTIDTLNRVVLDGIIDASRQIDDMIQQVFLAEDDATNPECAQLATASWYDDIVASGQEISQCSQTADTSAGGLTTSLFEILEEAQRQSVTVQNMVVNGFIDWNPLDPVQQLSAIIDGRLNEVEGEFNRSTAVELQEGLEEMNEKRGEIEEQVQDCLEMAVERLLSSGNVLLEILQEC